MDFPYTDTQQIKAQYQGYNNHPAFEVGYQDAINGRRFQELPDFAGCAYDRGFEAGNKVLRSAQWVEQNVGLN